jgi:molybdate transport repressor ModE-like protein
MAVSITESDSWLGIEFRHLAALEAIASLGSFSRAAKRLGYTQSAVSQQLATLERVVGVRLVERSGGPRPVSLTEAGSLLLRHAEAIVARLQAARADMEALGAGSAGMLRVATFQSVGARVLPRVLREFRAAWPAIELQLREAETGEDLERLLERGEVDLAFVMPPLGGPVLDCLDLLSDPYVVVVPASSELAQGSGPLPLSDLAGEALIGYRTCSSIHALETSMRSLGVEPEVVFRSDDNSIVQGMVAAGLGAAILPLLAVDPANEGTVVRELIGGLPPRRIGIAWHRDRYRSAATNGFIETARAACAAIPGTFEPAFAVSSQARSDG